MVYFFLLTIVGPSIKKKPLRLFITIGTYYIENRNFFVNIICCEFSILVYTRYNCPVNIVIIPNKITGVCYLKKKKKKISTRV